MPDTATQEFLALQEALAGRYSLERELGRGGMGIVYLAHEVALDRPVALKLLPPGYAARPELRERFLREARTAAKLSHPNIVPIFAVDEVDEFVFFAMAYIDGEALGHRIRTRGPLPASEAARILREVAWALAYAHAQGVVHRDVKPDNVLLESGSGRALVADFGIAHVHERPGMTEVGEVLGTAEFMSPEQASGEAVDARSDIYSLGVVGYYALSGKLPFEAPTVAAVLAKHITQPAPPVTSVAPEAPHRLAQAIDRCLGKDPSHRFANGEELAEALGTSLEVRRELPVPLRVFINKNREAFRASPLLVLFLLPMLMGLIAEVVSGDVVASTILGLIIGVFIATPIGMLAHMARRLLKSGYGVEDAVAALKTDIERRREELAFEYGRKASLVERVSKGIAVLAATIFGLSFVGLAIDPDWVVPIAAMSLSAPVAIGSGIIAAHRYERRVDRAGERRFKIWKGRLGRWLFKLGGVGIKRLAGAAAATYRRTELAIGMAADRLFEELPKEMRRNLKDLPDVVRRLEADAQKMRNRVDELNAILGEIGGERVGGRALAAAAQSKGHGALLDQRDALAGNLEKTRDAAQQRLADAVASLETIRLDLLRMQAGAGSVEGITTDLASARELLEDIERVLEGQQEVEQMLKGGRTQRR